MIFFSFDLVYEGEIYRITWKLFDRFNTVANKGRSPIQKFRKL